MRVFREFKKTCSNVNCSAFLNIFLAALLVGAIVHEVVNLLLFGHPTRICLHLGELPTVVSICCLSEEEMKNVWLSSEVFPLVIQFLVVFLWVFAFKSIFMDSKQKNGEKQP